MNQTSNSSRELAATSGPLDPSIDIVVCIPSFRRPQHLRRTLESLANQRTGRRFAVVVVENDALRRESVPVAIEFFWTGNIPGLCLVEPRQGNCHAINAAFETALETFPDATDFLMIDDDEVASPDWLEQMVRAAENTGADVIGFQKRFSELRREHLPAWATAEYFDHYYRLATNTRMAPSESGKTLRVGDPLILP